MGAYLHLFNRVFGSSRFIYAIAILVVLAAYIRLFFGIDVTDEAYHVAASLITALGGQFFVNDSQIGQSASLIYEPIMLIYNYLFGSFGVILFVRHLYFLLALTCAVIVFRHLKKTIAPDLACLISIFTIVYTPYPSPTLGYNSIGSLFFTIGAIVTLEGITSRRLLKIILGGWAFSLAVFAYPALGAGVLFIYAVTFFDFWRQHKKTHRDTLIGAVTFLLFYLGFWSLTLFRFGFDQIQNAIEMTQLYGSGTLKTDFLEYKLNFFIDTLNALAPPLWALSALLVAVVIFTILKVSWPWTLLCVGLLFIIFVPQPRSDTTSPLLYISAPMITIAFLLAFFSQLKTLRIKELSTNTTLIFSGLIMAAVCFLNSSTQIVASAMGSRLGLTFLLAQSATQASRLAIIIPLSCFYLFITYYGYIFSYREQSVTEMNRLLTSGPFAGIFVSDLKADTIYQLESDLRRTSEGASSIVSYDNFPAGFLFTQLRPATRSIFIHPLPYGHWDRSKYKEYYLNDENRPDIVLQVEVFPYSKNSFSVNRNQWTKEPLDTFFDYLPSLGDYELVQTRTLDSKYTSYKIWRKKSLPKIKFETTNMNL